MVTLVKGLLVVLMVATIAVWAVVFRPQYLWGDTSYAWATGRSMEGTLAPGTFLILKTQDIYSINDIVGFRVGKPMIVHRIIHGDMNRGFVLKGDNNPLQDPLRVKSDQVVGKLWVQIPWAGRFVRAAQQPIALGIMASLATFYFFRKAQKKYSRRRGATIT